MKSRLGTSFLLISAFLLPSLASAQTAVVTYGVQLPVPALGTAGLFVMGLILALAGLIWVKKHPKTAHKFSVSIITAGLLTSAGAGGWLVSNADALPAITDYLLSENSSPVTLTSFPATLTNDLMDPATILSMEVSDCQGDTAITGTCAVGASLTANGGSCSLDSVCAPVIISGQQCDTGNDIYTNSEWVICDATPDDAWISAATNAGGEYNADLICQELGYDRADEHGGTCGNICGRCEADTSCSAPGNKIFDGGGDGTPGDYGLFLRVTVHWTCANDPET